VAVVGLAGLAWLAWVVLAWLGSGATGHPRWPTLWGILQLVFASVAGAGALVALIVACRRLVAGGSWPVVAGLPEGFGRCGDMVLLLVG